MPSNAPFGVAAALSPRPIFGWDASHRLAQAIGAVAIGAAVFAAYHAYRAMARRRRNGPRALFRELCREHTLNSAERRELSRAARALGLAQGVDLFVDFEAWNPLLGEGQPDDRRGRLEALRHRLFS
ncbi:MAG: hypothetical protein FJ297_02140 [Planctomycetes bacterium]|nr:hypothetical protein [Planctomycetota bacterium]